MIEITFEKKTVRFQVDDLQDFKRKAFAWATQFEIVSYLDSNNYQDDKYFEKHNMNNYMSFIYDNFTKEMKYPIIKCKYCGHNSNGNYRAPEELSRQPLEEKLDVWSIALVIWQLFVGYCWSHRRLCES